MIFENSVSLVRSLLHIVLSRILKTDLERHYFLLLRENEILKRKNPRPRLRQSDRLFFAALSDVSRSLAAKVRIVQPETILIWHRKLSRGIWARYRALQPGRPTISEEARNLILEMKRLNPRWGMLRISGELKKLKIRVSKRTVARVLRKSGHSPGRRKRAGVGWFTFLKNQSKRI